MVRRESSCLVKGSLACGDNRMCRFQYVPQAVIRYTILASSLVSTFYMHDKTCICTFWLSSS